MHFGLIFLKIFNTTVHGREEKKRYMEICLVRPRIKKGEKWYIQSFSQDQNELRWLGGLAAITYVSEKDLP